MRITPLDIRKQVFHKKVLGFDVDEVKNFMEMIATDLERLNNENQELAQKVKSMETEMGMYKKIEQNMQDTLMTAQRVTDEIKVNAQKEADLIVKDAQIRAHREMEIAREKVLGHQKELTTLRHQKEMFVSRFRSLVNTQLEMLNILETESKAPANRTEPAKQTSQPLPPTPPASPAPSGTAAASADSPPPSQQPDVVV